MKLPKLIMGRNGRWLLSYAEKNPATGTWATRTVTTHTSVRPEAEAFRRRYVSNMSVLGVNAGGQDTDGDRAPPLLGELIDDFLADLDQRSVRASAERLTLPKIASGELGGLHAHQLTPEVIGLWCKRRRVANSTLRRDLATLKAVLALAVRNRRIGAADKPHIAMPPAGSPRDVWLREGEEQKLWDIAIGDTDGRGHLTEACAFVCLALSTGARREAICELTWDRVDIGHRLLDFRKPSRRATKKVRAVTPINDRLLPVLTRLRDEWEQRGALNPRVVQPARHGSWWPEFQVERLLGAHGFGHVTPHVFRHTFITLNLRAGVSPWDVSQMAGVSPLVLIKHYAHHIQDARLLAQANRRFAA